MGGAGSEEVYIFIVDEDGVERETVFGSGEDNTVPVFVRARHGKLQHHVRGIYVSVAVMCAGD